MSEKTFPMLAVDDPDAAAALYVEAFDFEISGRMPAEGEAQFVFLARGPNTVALGRRREGQPDDALCLHVGDVDAVAALLRARGVEEVSPPADRPWGERIALFRDRDGHTLVVVTLLA